METAQQLPNFRPSGLLPAGRFIKYLKHWLMARSAERATLDNLDFVKLVGHACWYESTRWYIAGCAFADNPHYIPTVVLERRTAGRGKAVATARIDEVLLFA